MMKFIKTTVIGGLLFLIPIILLIMILTKVHSLLLVVAKPLDDVIPLDKVGGIAVANILVIIMIILICFLAGILATGKYMKKFQHGIESKLLIKLPGFAIIKGFMDSIKTTEEASENFIPVLVAFDDSEQVCFEVERTSNEKVVVYLPGAPNPWSGTVLYVDKARVKRLNTSVTEAVNSIQMLGLGTENLINKK